MPRETTASANVRCLAGTPLPGKLGLLSRKSVLLEVALVGEPENFRELLGEVPSNVHLSARLMPCTDLVLWFVRTLAELGASMESLALQLPPGASVWIGRPKQHRGSEVTEHHVRDAGLSHGLVDYKICSIDKDPSGMKFAHR